jgi:hypothetical protein
MLNSDDAAWCEYAGAAAPKNNPAHKIKAEMLVGMMPPFCLLHDSFDRKNIASQKSTSQRIGFSTEDNRQSETDEP